MSLLEICRDYDIPVLSGSSAVWEQFGSSPLNPGMAVVLEGKPYIICKSGLPKELLRYTIAHELGHILLGHLTFREKNGEYPMYMETEANIFAAVMIALDLNGKRWKEAAG